MGALGRSSSPAGSSRAPANYPPSGLTQRVLAPAADHAGQVRHVPFAANSNSPFGTAGIREVRDVAAAYMRGNADRHGDRGPSLVAPHTTSPAISSASRLTLSRGHHNQLYNESNLRDLASHMHYAGILANSFPGSLTSAAISPANAADAAIAAVSAASAETAHKRPRLDLAPHPSGSNAGSSGSSSAAISQPLRIDTRE